MTERQDQVMLDPPPKPPDLGAKSFKDALVHTATTVVGVNGPKDDDVMVATVEGEEEEGMSSDIPFIIYHLILKLRCVNLG